MENQLIPSKTRTPDAIIPLTQTRLVIDAFFALGFSDGAPETAIVLGSGLAILRLAKHYPKTQFIALKRSNDQLPETPRIQLRDLHNLTTQDTDNVQFSNIDDT